MILPRWIMLVCTHIMIYSTNTSPNLYNEMGAKRSDISIKEGRLNYMFLRTLIHATILFTIEIGYILTYGSLEYIMWSEIFLFVFATIGWSLRMWCYVSLGNLFTFNLGIRNNHYLRTDGPYKYLVHPSYTGQMLNVFSTYLLLDANIWFILGMAIYATFILLYRMQIEEEMMMEKFGDYYVDFLTTRWKLIPKVY